jgi:ABC-type transporter Mla MlaB component
MLQHAIETLKEGTVLKLSGEITIGDTDDLRSILIELFNRSESVEIDVSSTTDIDMTCLQLLCASHRHAAGLNKHIRLNQEWSKSFEETAHDTGFLRQTGCSFDSTNECLWLRGKCNG